jgi:hypothetical protein
MLDHVLLEWHIAKENYFLFLNLKINPIKSATTMNGIKNIPISKLKIIAITILRAFMIITVPLYFLTLI